MQRVRFLAINGKPLLNWALVLFLIGLVLGAAHRPVRQTTVNLSSAVSGKTVMIDPGHGGADPGAVRASGVPEKDIVLAIAKKLEPMLNRAAIYTIMTRDSDKDLADTGTRSFSTRKRADLNNRVLLANQHDVDIFVSIHGNAFPESIWSGAQTFFYPGKEDSEQLAVSIQTEMVSRLGPNKRQARPGSYWVLEKTKMPAVVVEVGFLSNPREAALLATPEYQEKVAEAIFYGIVRYFAQQQTDTKSSDAEQTENETETTIPETIQLGPDEVALYFDGPTNNDDGLAVEVRKSVEGRGIRERSLNALLELIKGPSNSSILRRTVPPETKVLNYWIKNSTAYVDFNSELRDKFWGGGRTEELTIYSIVNTLTEFPEIKAVQISIEGDTKTTIGGHLMLDDPFARNSKIVLPSNSGSSYKPVGG